MNLVRKYKISKLLNKDLEGVEAEIIVFIETWLSDLIPFVWDKNKNSDYIYFMNSKGEYVLERDKQNTFLLVRYDGFWKVLSDKYNLTYIDIQNILKIIFKEYFKEQISIPSWGRVNMRSEIENAFKNNLQYYTYENKGALYGIESAFKRKMGIIENLYNIGETSITFSKAFPNKVEEAYELNKKI